MRQGDFNTLKETIGTLKNFNKVLLLTCSNRGEEVSKTQIPKSSIIAKLIHKNLPSSTLIDVTKLKIYPCEGNVSRMEGNVCGIKEALLQDTSKNPTGFHRCWASIHNPDDELWMVSKSLFESDCVIFFSSVRWGAANMFYQKLIERLNWINNRFIPYGEDNIIKNITSGFIIVGQHQSAFEITQIAESIIPTHRAHLGKSITIRGPHAFFILVLKQAIEVTAIHICVQQFIIAYLTLGQGFSPHHSQSYTAHVRTVPMFS